jgi:hypothetical protein
LVFSILVWRGRVFADWVLERGEKGIVLRLVDGEVFELFYVGLEEFEGILGGFLMGDGED